MKVGDTVWLLPVGNAARYGTPELKSKTVSKVGRKYFTVGNGYGAVKFYLEDKRQVTDYSANWALYLTEQEYHDEKERSELESEFRSIFDCWTGTKLTLTQLRQIKLVIDTPS